MEYTCKQTFQGDFVYMVSSLFMACSWLAPKEPFFNYFFFKFSILWGCHSPLQGPACSAYPIPLCQPPTSGDTVYLGTCCHGIHTGNCHCPFCPSQQFVNLIPSLVTNHLPGMPYLSASIPWGVHHLPWDPTFFHHTIPLSQWLKPTGNWAGNLHFSPCPQQRIPQPITCPIADYLWGSVLHLWLHSMGTRQIPQKAELCASCCFSPMITSSDPQDYNVMQWQCLRS